MNYRYEFSVGSGDQQRYVRVIAANDRVARRGVGVAHSSEMVKKTARRAVIFARKPKATEIHLFYRTMARTLSSFDDDIKALNASALQVSDPVLKGIIGDFIIRRSEGESLSDVFSRYSDVFGETTSNRIDAGQRSGRVREVFQSLEARFLEQREVRQKVVQAIMFPVFELVLMTIMLVAWILVMVPLQKRILEQHEVEVPGIIMFFSVVSEILRSNPIAWVFIASVFALVFLYRKQINRWYSFDWIKTKVPILGSFYKKAKLHAVMRLLSDMLSNGVGVRESLLLLKNSTTNSVIKRYVAGIANEIVNGKDWALAFYAHYHLIGKEGLYMASSMQIADKTGDHSGVLSDLADDFYSDVLYQSKVLPAVIGMVVFVAMLAMGVSLILLFYLPTNQAMNSAMSELNQYIPGK